MLWGIGFFVLILYISFIHLNLCWRVEKFKKFPCTDPYVNIQREYQLYCVSYPLQEVKSKHEHVPTQFLLFIIIDIIIPSQIFSPAKKNEHQSQLKSWNSYWGFCKEADVALSSFVELWNEELLSKFGHLIFEQVTNYAIASCLEWKVLSNTKTLSEIDVCVTLGESL